MTKPNYINKAAIDKFFNVLANELKEPAQAILTGAAAGTLLGGSRATRDLDFAIRSISNKNWNALDEAVHRTVQQTKIQANYAEDIDRWGMISLLDYEKHATTYKKFASLRVLIMDPAYWAIGKLTRYYYPDARDLGLVFKKKKPPLNRTLRVWSNALKASPKSDALQKFIHHVSLFFNEHGKSTWGNRFDADAALQKLYE